MYSAETIERTLRRMFSNGLLLDAMPRRRENQQMLLCLAAGLFKPDSVYTEREVNEILRNWLASFCSPFGLDHVTFRRWMADTAFLLRDTDGSNYRINRVKIAESLDEDARNIDPGKLLNEVRLEKEKRRRTYQA